jgi:hypothetical protein
MTIRKINITVNLNGLLGELQTSLQRISYIVAGGINNSSNLSMSGTNIPGKSMFIDLGGNLNWNDDQLKNEFNKWILEKGFNDSIENVSYFLETTHKILSYWEIMALQNGKGIVSGADWNRIIKIGEKKYQKLFIPEKLSHLVNEHKLVLQDNLVSHLLSINSARNCLVHRKGIVGERDINTLDGLEVKWFRLGVWINKGEGEAEYLHGEPKMVNTGDVISVGNTTVVKVFKLGESVAFTSQEFVDITWGIYIFGVDVINKVGQFGILNGYITQ